MHLVIISGLGDHTWFYHLLQPLWRRHGYRIHIYRYGWGDAASLADAQRQLCNKVDQLTTDVYVVGVSAGGSAAVNLLHQRPSVRAVATIASPYELCERLDNQLLVDSITETETVMASAAADIKAKILSIHGIHDWRVHIDHSQPSGVETCRIPVVGHPLVIVAALTFFSGRWLEFFRTR